MNKITRREGTGDGVHYIGRGTHCWAHATIMRNDQVCVTARGTFKLVEST